jgi:hypothetical protein
VKYVNEPHHGCIESGEKAVEVVKQGPRRRRKYCGPIDSTLGSRGALDGTCLAERPAPLV